jgi:hypothetical protein
LAHLPPVMGGKFFYKTPNGLRCLLWYCLAGRSYYFPRESPTGC